MALFPSIIKQWFFPPLRISQSFFSVDMGHIGTPTLYVYGVQELMVELGGGAIPCNLLPHSLLSHSPVVSEGKWEDKLKP